MIQNGKNTSRYDVIADTAHMIMVVSQELSSLYKDSFINNERIELRRRHLTKYVDKLNKLTKRFNSQALQQDKVDRDKAFRVDHNVYEDSYVQ